MCKLNKNLKSALEKVKYFLLDLDGTLYFDGTPIGDMKNTLKFLRDKGKKLIYLTNNSSKNTNLYVEKLKSIGFYGQGDLVYSSGVATAEYLLENYKNKSVYVLGTNSYKKELISLGVNVLDDYNADIALLTYDTELNYDKLCNFVRAINKGAKYLATHPDITCPAIDVFLPDAGSFMKMIKATTSKEPEIIIGKPNVIMGENLMKKFKNFDKEAYMMVGDRLYTDIAFGRNCGFYQILVLSGETTLNMLEKESEKPNFVLETFNDIKNYF